MMANDYFILTEDLYVKQINCLYDILLKRLQNEIKYIPYF